jgi:hypothetical protein
MMVTAAPGRRACVHEVGAPARHHQQSFDDLVHHGVSLAERAVIGDPRGARRWHQIANATRPGSSRTASPKPTSRNRSGFRRRRRSAPKGDRRFDARAKIAERSERSFVARHLVNRDALCARDRGCGPRGSDFADGRIAVVGDVDISEAVDCHAVGISSFRDRVKAPHGCPRPPSLPPSTLPADRRSRDPGPLATAAW